MNETQNRQEKEAGGDVKKLRRDETKPQNGFEQINMALKLHLGRVLALALFSLRWRLVVEVLRHATLLVLQGWVRSACQQKIDDRLRER